MIDLNTRLLKQGEQIQKNVLYRINESAVIPVREKHDKTPNVEVVNLAYDLKEGQYAVFANEFHSSNISKHGCKSTDILTCLIDDDKRKICSLIADIKKNISAFSDDLLKDGALMTTIKEVGEFIEQIHHAMLHKESFILYLKDEGFTEKTEIGIATQNFEDEKFLKAAQFLEMVKDMQKPHNMQPLLWYKFKNNLMPYVSETAKLRRFSNHEVEVCGKLYLLNVYLLEKVTDLEYAVEVEMKIL